MERVPMREGATFRASLISGDVRGEARSPESRLSEAGGSNGLPKSVCLMSLPPGKNGVEAGFKAAPSMCIERALMRTGSAPGGVCVPGSLVRGRGCG
jgi:hypothetical protein